MKLKLDNGTTLHVKLQKDHDEGGIDIMVANTKQAFKSDDETYYLATLLTDGTLRTAGYLQGNVDGLKFDSKTRAIKVV